MKRIKIFVMIAILSVMLTGCTLYEDEWTECRPLPEIEIPVEPGPWEPPVDGGESVGN